MRKKLFSIVMCLAMVTMLFAGCKKTKESNVPDDANVTTQAPEVTDAPVTTQAPVSTSSELPKPVYYYSFDEADGTDGIQVAIKDTAATPIVQPVADKDVVFVDGVKGQAIYADGVTAYKLPEVNGVGDNYTISYWVNASRCATYMPTVQFGPDIHGDLTGGQHYVNFTWAEWSGESAFPCVWAYDQLDGAKWPNYSPEAGEGTHVKEWLNITLVVDSSNLTEDETLLYAKLYVNNVLYSDQVKLVFNTMQPSDNFEMLLGLNYWDATFKGAFDEFYVFDTCLDESQVAQLYNAGNQQATYKEPEHVFEFYQEAAAIDSIGKTDLSTAWWSDFSQAWKISDGQTMQFKLHNWSDAIQSYDNYVMVFANSDVPADVIPSADTIPGYAEYAVVRADAFGWTPAGDLPANCFNYTWGNWGTWSNKVMRDADVTITVTRDGSNLSIQADNVDYNESTNTLYANLENVVNGEDCYMFFTCEGSYVDILSAKDKTVSANAGLAVGNADCSTGWWSAFSPIWNVPVGETRTVGFINRTDGAENWRNFVAILQNTPTGHSADTAGYAEYAVVRADNYGWGAGYDGIVVPESNWNWDTFKADMDGAHVSLSVTNNGDTADICATIVTADGKEYFQNYKGITTGGDLYFCLSCEGAYLQFDSNVVGSIDCSTGWWSQFSDIWAVPAGETKSVSFRNYTDGAENWRNFVAILQNSPAGHSADAYEGYAEYAVVRADNYGWGAGYDGIVTPESNWNWDTFKEDMDGAYVDLTVANNGTTADIICHITTVDGAEYFQNYKGIAINGDLYFCLSCEGSYLVIDADQIGPNDNVLAFWSRFGKLTKVENGKTESVSFTNYTDGANNWDNFVVILQTTPTGHSADTEGYAEYAVVRADNYGWGAGYDGIVVPESNWNWDTFTADMDGAHVQLNVTNNGSTADIDFFVTTADGKTYFQKYDGIAVTGDVYYCISGEAGHFVCD